MPLRKPHTKSRFGCLPCKKRHIKCGEETPACRNCVFRKVDCVYGSTTGASPRDISRATSSEATGSPNLLSHEEPPWPPGKLHAHGPASQSAIGVSRQQELQLMVYYMNKTSRTLAHDEEELRIWTEAIPEEAAQYDFLMDGLLALASLHFACYNPDSRREYTEFAIRYQNLGLQKYNDALGNINGANCTALFVFSILLNLMAIALPNASPDSAFSAHTESMMTMLELAQGIGIIHSKAVPILRNGKLASFFRTMRTDLEPNNETKAALEILHQQTNSLLKSGSIEEDRHALYLSGIWSLEVAFGCTTLSSHLGPIIGWPGTVWPEEHRDELMRLIRHGDVMAQLILMHYGVLLLHIRHHWWGKRTGISLIEDLAISVRAAGPSWAELTEWPREIARQTEERNKGASRLDSSFPDSFMSQDPFTT